jgi:hypothetical protein
MSERFKALLSDSQRWAKEAALNWLGSASEDPVPHAFSIALGILLMLILAGIW